MSSDSKGLRRVAKRPPPSVEGWIGYFKKALKIRRLANYGSEDTLIRTAGLVAIVGPAGDSKGVEAYQALVSLFLSEHRIKQWAAGLEKIPANVEAITRLVKSVTAAGTLEPVERARFGLMTFIEVAIKLPDPKAYVEAARSSTHTLIRSAFHPNTLTHIAARYRGVVGDLADTSYRDQISATIKTIS